VRGLNVAWNTPCKFRLTVLFACRYVDGEAAAAAASGPEMAALPVVLEDDRRRWCWWCDDEEDEEEGSRSGLGARDCTRDGTWLVLRLADRLDGAVSGGLTMSRCVVVVVVSTGGGGVF
jgi:hypothetical protein